jgi:hypothetical protein
MRFSYRAGLLRPSATLNFLPPPPKFESRNTYLLFRLKGTSKSKDETSVNERIILALANRDDCV